MPDLPNRNASAETKYPINSIFLISPKISEKTRSIQGVTQTIAQSIPYGDSIHVSAWSKVFKLLFILFFFLIFFYLSSFFFFFFFHFNYPIVPFLYSLLSIMFVVLITPTNSTKKTYELGGMMNDNYAIYLDIAFNDGSYLFAQSLLFPTGIFQFLPPPSCPLPFLPSSSFLYHFLLSPSLAHSLSSLSFSSVVPPPPTHQYSYFYLFLLVFSPSLSFSPSPLPISGIFIYIFLLRSLSPLNVFSPPSHSPSQNLLYNILASCMIIINAVE